MLTRILVGEERSWRPCESQLLAVYTVAMRCEFAFRKNSIFYYAECNSCGLEQDVSEEQSRGNAQCFGDSVFLEWHAAEDD
ncbi:MAG: hypothetical protein QOD84_2673 [Acidobacteriaceae bacterium]